MLRPAKRPLQHQSPAAAGPRRRPLVVPPSRYRADDGAPPTTTIILPPTATALITVDEDDVVVAAPTIEQQQKQRLQALSQLEAAAQPPRHELPLSYPAAFLARRWWAFAGIVVGYTAFYVTRSSLTYAAPLMVADPTSGVTLSTVGALTSVFPVAYGASKFASGVLGANVSARLMLSVGLTLTAAVNFLFGVGGPVGWLCALWALNGVLQGCGAPACASILTRWYAAKERGTYWGAWSMSHNLGGFLAPVIVGAAATALGWRWGMWAPAVVGGGVGAFMLAAVRDSPEECGFEAPDGGRVGGKAATSTATTTDTNKRLLSASIARAALDKSSSSPKSQSPSSASSLLAALQSLSTGPVGAVLRNPLVWALAFTYFFVYVVRQGVTSWLMFYLMAEKGVTDATTAALTVSGLELGGLCGGAAAGLISDQAIKRAGPNAGHVGRRVRVCMAYTAGMAVALLALKAVPAGQPLLLAASVATLGFCIYGPQMLVGLAGAELVSPAGVGASQGLLGWIAYLGAANAGVPIASVVQRSGWGGFFTAMLGATFVVMLLLSSASNARSYAQQQVKEA
jgi:sugar phosphate permease